MSRVTLDKNTIPSDGDNSGGNIDTTPPTITLIGSSIVNVPVGTEFNDPGAIATDNIDSSVNVDIIGTIDITRFKHLVKYIKLLILVEQYLNLKVN